jgi:hypothetical protein
VPAGAEVAGGVVVVVSGVVVVWAKVAVTLAVPSAKARKAMRRADKRVFIYYYDSGSGPGFHRLELQL